ncbi:MAG TPA: PGPGW domain-containing protein [Verrucomicrobiota bacterium]|nr:PGPGW domain-containing protein [Verrucomicrobiota bacterium]
MKKFFIALIGGTVLLVGTAMLVLPGPGLPIVAAGLAILATEFLWARRARRRAKGAAAKVYRKSGLKDWLRRWRKPAPQPHQP